MYRAPDAGMGRPRLQENSQALRDGSEWLLEVSDAAAAVGSSSYGSHSRRPHGFQTLYFTNRLLAGMADGGIHLAKTHLVARTHLQLRATLVEVLVGFVRFGIDVKFGLFAIRHLDRVVVIHRSAALAVGEMEIRNKVLNGPISRSAGSAVANLEGHTAVGHILSTLMRRRSIFGFDGMVCSKRTRRVSAIGPTGFPSHSPCCY